MKNYLLKHSFFLNSICSFIGLIIAATIWAYYGTFISAFIGTVTGFIICFIGAYLANCSQQDINNRLTKLTEELASKSVSLEEALQVKRSETGEVDSITIDGGTF